MRASAVLAFLFAAAVSATSVPRMSTPELDARLAKAAELDKRCICVRLQLYQATADWCQRDSKISC